MSKQLPKQPSLEHLKNEAKALLRQAKTGETQIGEPKLVNAQLAVAREYGFASWSKLKRFVEGYASNVEAFFAAIRAGDRQRVEALIEDAPGLAHTFDPNSFGAPPVVAAVNREDRPMIELLLKHGADINARSDWWAGSFGVLDSSDEDLTEWLRAKGAKMTAHAAARLGYADELRQMIAHQPEVVHERGGDGQYPLHFAKTAEIVDILVDAGADIEARDLDHEGTPLQNRVMEESVRQRLFERGAKTDIFSAIALDRLALVKKHLEEDPATLRRSVGEAGNPMIPQAPGRHIYCYTVGHVRPYQLAANLGRKEIFDYLFQQSPATLQLVAATWNGDEQAAKGVIKENPSVISDLTYGDKMTLIQACWNPRPITVKLMLEVGFDVNVKDHESMSPIHWAAFHGQDDLVEIILPYKPDLDAKNVYGGTALGTGCYGSIHGWHKDGDFARSTELLIQAGSKLPEKASGSPEVMEVLRKHGVPA